MQKRETFARTLAVRSTRLIRLTCFILLLSTQTLAKADYETTLCDKLLYNKAELKSFAQWISSHGPTDPVMSYPLTPKSFGTILTGNERDHLLQVRQIINCSEIFYYKEVSNWLVLDAKAFQAEQRIESSEEQQRDINEVVFRWLADRVYVVEKTAGHAATNDEAELELEWSVVYIVNAETLTTFQVNDLLSKLWNKRLCQLQSLTVKRVEGMEIRCSKLALFFSTSIGSEKVIVRFDSKNGKSDMDQNANHQNVQDFIFKKVRTLWPKGIIYSSYRRLVSIVHGRIEEETVYKLMQEQAQRRADSQQALPTTISSTSPSTGTIQLDVFEKAGFIGQEPVIAAVKQALSSVKSGLKLSNGPLIFLFAGLPGTGKTFLSQLIAMAYNYDVEKFEGKDISNIIDYLRKQHLYLHVDMGNYQDDRAIDGFVDPSPGLEGEGLLSTLFSTSTKQLESSSSGVGARNSRAVVVLDEVEKAHPSLLKDMLLPVLDSNNGHVQKKKTGEMFNTKDAVFVLTTNCFDDIILQLFHEKKSYQEIVNVVGTLFTNSKSTCLSANVGGNAGSMNPFSWGPLWRRILAGQSLATSGKFLAFLPPRERDVDNLVEQSLERLHRTFQSRFDTGSSTQSIAALYYTERALQKLQTRAKRQEYKANMAQVEGFIERVVAELILNATREAATPVVQGSSAVLFVAHTNTLALMLQPPVASLQNAARESWLDTMSSFFEPNTVGDAKDRYEVAYSQDDEQPPALQLEVRKTSTGQMPGRSLATSNALEPAHDSDAAIALNASEAFQFMVTIAVAVVLLYFFFLPVIKSLVVMTALILGVLGLVNPKLALEVLKALATLGTYLFALIRSGYAKALILLLLLCGCAYMFFQKGSVSMSLWKSNASCERNKQRRSKRQDIIRRWALIYLRLMVHYKLKKAKRLRKLHSDVYDHKHLLPKQGTLKPTSNSTRLHSKGKAPPSKYRFFAKNLKKQKSH